MKKSLIIFVAALLLCGCQKSPPEQAQTDPTVQTTGQSGEISVDIEIFEDPTTAPTDTPPATADTKPAARPTVPTQSAEPTVPTTEPTGQPAPTQPETEDSGFFKPILRP